jgi:hypothetical protein
MTHHVRATQSGGSSKAHSSDSSDFDDGSSDRGTYSGWIYKRRYQNRIASANFRARGKERESEATILLKKVALLEEFNAAFEEELSHVRVCLKLCTQWRPATEVRPPSCRCSFQQKHLVPTLNSVACVCRRLPRGSLSGRASRNHASCGKSYAYEGSVGTLSFVGIWVQ